MQAPDKKKTKTKLNNMFEPKYQPQHASTENSTEPG